MRSRVARLEALEREHAMTPRDPRDMSMNELCRWVARLVPEKDLVRFGDEHGAGDGAGLAAMVRAHVPNYGSGAVA